MPRSCGLTLRTLRTRKKLETEELTEMLRQHTKRFKPAQTKFSDDTITRAEHSQQTLYWVLDAYAKWSGYPVGFIYLFARISCELRERNVDAAKAIAQSLRSLVQFIDENANLETLNRLQPVVISHDGPERPYDELGGTAYDTVIRYHQHLPSDHPESRHRTTKGRIKYIESQQFIDDARQVRILLEMLSKVPPSQTPGE